MVRPPLDRLGWFYPKSSARFSCRQGQIQAEHLDTSEKDFNCFPDAGPGFGSSCLEFTSFLFIQNRKTGPLGQVRDDRRCHRSNLFMGFRCQELHNKIWTLKSWASNKAYSGIAACAAFLLESFAPMFSPIPSTSTKLAITSYCFLTPDTFLCRTPEHFW